VAINPAVLERIECEGADARILDAHIVMNPDGLGKAAICAGHYLDSNSALRRLLKK
jgi:hypothetical protein